MTDATTETVIVCCGPTTGKRKKLRCPCCGFESDNFDSFCMSTCWPCSGVGGGNLNCANCISAGAWVDRFRSGGKGHRMLRWEKGKRHVLTACGVRIARREIGQACAVVPECKRCWKEPA